MLCKGALVELTSSVHMIQCVSQWSVMHGVEYLCNSDEVIGYKLYLHSVLACASLALPEITVVGGDQWQAMKCICVLSQC